MFTVYNLSRKVPNRTLFTGFDLSASAGGIVVVSGPSGIGKTQLLRALACLDPLNPEAELTLDNKKPEAYGYPGWRARVAYVYQGRVSLKGTVKEHFDKVRNFAAHKERLEGDQGTVEELQALFLKAGLGSDLSAPEKNEDFLDRHWQDLSGGEFQRALLCCCLALRPQVLLLDEPTSACDPASTRAVEELLLSSNATLIVVTHDAEQAERLKTAAEGRPGGLQTVAIASGLEMVGVASGTGSEAFTLFDMEVLLGSGNATDDGAIPVDVWTLTRTSGLVLGVLVLSTLLGLGQSQQIAIASLRALVQLSILGVILEPIFKYAQWWVVSLYVLFMATVAAQSAIGRPRYTYAGILWHMCLAAWTAPVAMTAVTVGVILQAHPVWEPQYAIPLAGMSLGNAVTAMSLAMDSLLKALKEGRDKVEVLLAAGATRSEACAEAVREAVQVALTPTINNLTVIGLVSIPGMMTGQIIGGNSPAAAAKYQLIVLIMILAACLLSAVLVSLLAAQALVSPEGFVLADAITRQPKSQDYLASLRRGLTRCGKGVYGVLCCCFIPRKPQAEDLSQPLTEDAA